MERELINENLIFFDVEVEDKEEVIEFIAQKMEKDGRLEEKGGYIEAVLKREKSSSTAIGFSTATPHAKSEAVKEPSLAFVRLKQPMQWDEEMVTMVFQIAVPSPGQGDRHLEILAKLFRSLVYDDFREQLSSAKSKQEIVELLREF